MQREVPQVDREVNGRPTQFLLLRARSWEPIQHSLTNAMGLPWQATHCRTGLRSVSYAPIGSETCFRVS